MACDIQKKNHNPHIINHYGKNVSPETKFPKSLVVKGLEVIC
jgi:hypothetical protein